MEETTFIKETKTQFGPTSVNGKYRPRQTQFKLGSSGSFASNFHSSSICPNRSRHSCSSGESSIKSAKKRHPACQVVRRKGRIYVINKVEPRYKARQG